MNPNQHKEDCPVKSRSEDWEHNPIYCASDACICRPWFSLLSNSDPEPPNDTMVETKGGYFVKGEEMIIEDRFSSVMGDWMNNPGDPSLWRPIEEDFDMIEDLDPNTYGGSEAAEILVDLLKKSGDRNQVRKVGNYWVKYCTRTNDLFYSKMPDKTKKHFLNLLFHDTKGSLEDSGIESSLRSYLLNIMSKQRKLLLKVWSRDNVG
tara:strand:- start:50171 stop:50788 length:618 start_codon:yes stop_codon:yes gene_type:complete